MEKDQKKQEELLKKQLEEQEKLELLAKADEIKELTLDFDGDGNIELKNELEALMLDPIDNPEEKHELYYKII